jgi:hypothetical protein
MKIVKKLENETQLEPLLITSISSNGRHFLAQFPEGEEFILASVFENGEVHLAAGGIMQLGLSAPQIGIVQERKT